MLVLPLSSECLKTWFTVSDMIQKRMSPQIFALFSLFLSLRCAAGSVVDQIQANLWSAASSALIGWESCQSDTRSGRTRAECHQTCALLGHNRGPTTQRDIQVVYIYPVWSVRCSAAGALLRHFLTPNEEIKCSQFASSSWIQFIQLNMKILIVKWGIFATETGTCCIIN